MQGKEDHNKNVQATLLYVPFSNLKEASKAAKTLLSANLIICANIIPGVLSIYMDNNIEKESPEAIVIFKTRKEKVEALKKTIENMHSYTIPVILEMDVKSLNSKAIPFFSNWD